MSFMEFQRRIGPSAAHTLGAVAVTYLIGLIGGLAIGAGVSSSFWAAALMTGWFLGREVEQLAPHLGWSENTPEVSEEQLNRAMRQTVWPAVFAHAAATSLWLYVVYL